MHAGSRIQADMLADKEGELALDVHISLMSTGISVRKATDGPDKVASLHPFLKY